MKQINYKSNTAIFLDIDGVANSDKTLARSPNKFIGVSSEKVTLLREIVKATGANIILSSSWRLMEPTDLDYQYLVKQLKYKGLYIKDKTPRIGIQRGKEVRQYLNEHPEITNYVILDDEFAQSFADEGLSEHYIQTDYTTGLTKKDVEKAIKILNNEFDYVDCRFSQEELRLMQGALFLCEEKQTFSQESTYLKSRDLRNKIRNLLNSNKTNTEHFGREL